MVDQPMVLGFFASLTLGVFTMTGALSALAWSRNRLTLAKLARVVEPYIRAEELSDLEAWLVQALEKIPFARGLLRDLRQFGVDQGPGRLMVYGLILAGVAFAGATFRTGSSSMGVAGFAGALVAEYGFVRWRAAQRWNQLRSQLPEALHVVASALSAGASLNQALKHSTREVAMPLQGELERLVEDVEVGKTLEEALIDLKTRVPLPEFDMVIASLLIQQRSGGNLGELLNEAAHLIKENEELRREMAVLTSQATASARLIGVLPVLLFGYLLATNRTYLDPMLTTNLGNMLLVLGGAMDVVGYLVVVRISTYSEYEE